MDNLRVNRKGSPHSFSGDLDFPYSYTFHSSDPRRPDRDSLRWQWLCEHVGRLDHEWAMVIPFYSDDDLTFLFKSQQDHALFVLTWA